MDPNTLENTIKIHLIYLCNNEIYRILKHAAQSLFYFCKISFIS
jgi:hypothetical protein